LVGRITRGVGVTVFFHGECDTHMHM
jgi:hypothetical protein